MGTLPLAQQPVSTYAGSVSTIASHLQSFDSRWPGDPAKAAQTILQIAESAKPPQRLALEGSSIDGIRQKMNQVAAELDQWEAVGRATTF